MEHKCVEDESNTVPTLKGHNFGGSFQQLMASIAAEEDILDKRKGTLFSFRAAISLIKAQYRFSISHSQSGLIRSLFHWINPHRMNQLGSLGKKLDGAGDGAQKPQASMTELFSSAKVVAEAAQATVSGGKDKIDQGKAAGAAADLLGAASQYGKLDDKGALGGCVKKAETYLNEYEASHSTKPGGAAAPGPESALPATKTAPSAGEDEKKESNSGDYLKMAQGFFK